MLRIQLWITLINCIIKLIKIVYLNCKNIHNIKKVYFLNWPNLPDKHFKFAVFHIKENGPKLLMIHPELHSLLSNQILNKNAPPPMPPLNN